ncbi:MAG: serine hydrolase, partial [Cyclobacteriaceae bacterium]|nr:serine hydrolase [Cyclobacteriaceae bacterium]
MIPASSYADSDDREKIEEQIREYGVGGIVFTQGGPVTQARLTNHFQSISNLPLLIGLNAEEGLGSTLDSTLVFPQTLMLGAIRSDSMIYYFGREVGRQMKELGVHISFAPTADLSTTFQSIELINHTFGDNPERVAKAGVMYMKGLQHSGIIPVVKHYPSYGLKVESYSKGNPVMEIVQDDPASIYPLKQLFDNGCQAVLSSYKHDPIFPDRRKRLTPKKKVVPSVLPTLYTADYLKKNLNFEGLVFSYVPDVGVVLKKYKPGDSEIYAFLAGNDILLFPENIGATIRKLRKQIKKNPLLSQQLDARVRKILAFKYDAGLVKKQVDEPDKDLLQRINTPEARILQQTLYEKSVTIVKDEHALLPIKFLDIHSFASLSIGERKENEFSKLLSKYASFEHFQFNKEETDTTQLIQELKKYSIVIAGVFSANSEKNLEEASSLLDFIGRHTNLVICNFGSPSTLSSLENTSAIIQAYVDDAVMRKIIPQIIFGGISASGILPLKITNTLQEGASKETTTLGRLAYSFPEAAGMSSQSLTGIDRIANEAISSRSTPGCQVMVVKGGKVIYDKSFGWQTYDNLVPVTDQTIYDLASVSKVLGTLQSVMFLYDKGLIDVNKKVSVYLPELKSTNKKDITLKDVLTHQAGLQPFVPLWQQTMKDEKIFLPEFYNSERNENYPYQVTSTLFGSQALKDSLWQWTFTSKMLDKPERTPFTLRYSDIGFWILHRLSEKLLNQPMEDFLWQNLYEPLGATSTGYLPLNRFNSSIIAPTEYDNIFRKSMIVGTVHDERAAMMGGVAGHAGLFGNAHDVAKLGQMLLQKGYYG